MLGATSIGLFSSNRTIHLTVNTMPSPASWLQNLIYQEKSATLCQMTIHSAKLDFWGCFGTKLVVLSFHRVVFRAHPQRPRGGIKMVILNLAKRAIVLIVEDDAFIRMAAVDFIEDAGFETLQASNADSAVLLLEARDDIRIVFTDIDMPGSMDGLKLALAVRGRWPPIEIIITSGKIGLAPAEIPDRGVFFSKPYVERDIISAMRRMSPARSGEATNAWR